VNHLHIEILGDAALALIAACDTALTVLGCPALETGMPRGEISHAQIQLRHLRAELFRKRGEALTAAITKARGRSNE
jgi:hypothetical protein